MIDIHCLFGDSFGAAIAEDLSSQSDYAVAISESVTTPSSRWPLARVQLVSTRNDTPTELDRIDAMAFHLERPWLPVVAKPRGFRIGPLIVPSRSGCYRCYRSRQYQHGRLNSTDRKIEATARTNRDVPVSGFLPAHVSLATRLIRRDVEAVLDGRAADRAGRLTTVRWLTSGVGTGRLIRVDGCDRCHAVRPPDSTWRSFSEFSHTRATEDAGL